MDYIGIPVIVVCCYIIGEIYKLIFKKKQSAYKYIPITLAVAGGILGIVIFYTNTELLCGVQNFWQALLAGIVSGASSTGTNQIIKQMFLK